MEISSAPTMFKMRCRVYSLRSTLIVEKATKMMAKELIKAVCDSALRAASLFAISNRKQNRPFRNQIQQMVLRADPSSSAHAIYVGSSQIAIDDTAPCKSYPRTWSSACHICSYPKLGEVRRIPECQKRSVKLNVDKQPGSAPVARVWLGFGGAGIPAESCYDQPAN
jgi:hypothetical protein